MGKYTEHNAQSNPVSMYKHSDVSKGYQSLLEGLETVYLFKYFAKETNMRKITVVSKTLFYPTDENPIALSLGKSI